MKLLNSRYTVGLILIIGFLLPGCGKVVDWVHDSFSQISSLDSNCATAEKYIRSVTAYDQLTTAAKFDALWLTNEVRMIYVDLFALKFGKTDEQKKALLRRQFEENNHFISFYVLSLYENPLGEQGSTWALFLTIDNKNYTPIEIKAVELLPEYSCMFGKKFNRFKIVYSVKFDAKDIDDMPIITSETRAITLVFRSVKKEATLTWDLSFGSADNNDEVS